MKEQSLHRSHHKVCEFMKAFRTTRKLSSLKLQTLNLLLYNLPISTCSRTKTNHFHYTISFTKLNLQGFKRTQIVLKIYSHVERPCCAFLRFCRNQSPIPKKTEVSLYACNSVSSESIMLQCAINEINSILYCDCYYDHLLLVHAH